MSDRWPGGLISRSAPVVVGPTGGEGGSAPGIWTINQIAPYVKAGTWPQPVRPRELWSWGYNGTGQLGLGNRLNKLSPNQVGLLTDWASISCSQRVNGFALAVKTDGTLWAWGYNGNGELGQGDMIDRSSPVQVGALTDWLKASAGYAHSLAVKTNGTLWSWGYNGYGELGLGNTLGTYSSPTQVGALTTWYSVSGGNLYSLAIKTDGTLWAWGRNNVGQLGTTNRTNYSSPKQVGALTTWSKISESGGYSHSLAVKTDGTLWAWGYNAFGELGQNNTIYRSSPVQIGALTTWSNVSNGANFSSAIKTDGTLWTWGNGGAGQLGINNTTNYSSPKQVGALTTWSSAACAFSSMLVVKTDGTLWSWGQNNNGQLGLGSTTYYSSPKQVGSDTTWYRVAAGGTSVSTIKRLS